MSAILSADDLNDFISPGVACIKPVETLPLQQPPANPYEVVREDQIVEKKSAQISLTDCLACSGCVTSAEAILVSLQSHAEVLSTLDATLGIKIDADGRWDVPSSQSKLFVASVSPQVRASLAATYGVSERQAGYMIEQFLSGPKGLRSGGKLGNEFTWVFDTNSMRQVSLVYGAEEVLNKAETPNIKRPVLGSACPGWICYAEKTHPHVLPHLSQLKSPQALAGTFLKSVLSKSLGISPHQIWHLAIMPCFDKKLEAARLELTDHAWKEGVDSTTTPIRDVDCVITAREILMMAESRDISFPLLPKTALHSSAPFPEPELGNFLKPTPYSSATQKSNDEGTSGGYLWHILKTVQAQNPSSKIVFTKGRNIDVIDFSVVLNDKFLFKASRNYGFRNIQNLVRRLRPARAGRGVVRRPNASAEPEVESSYVEVMACPGGCTNGGGQIKLSDLSDLQSTRMALDNPKEWQALIDEAYYSMDSSDEELERTRGTFIANQDDIVNGISISNVHNFVQRWIDFTGITREKLLHTTYRAVESDVGKDTQPATERVAELAGKIGGGW